MSDGERTIEIKAFGVYLRLVPELRGLFLNLNLRKCSKVM